MRILVVGVGTSREFGFQRLRAAGHRIGMIDDLSFIPTELADWYHPVAASSGAQVAEIVGSAGQSFDVVLCFGEWHLSTAVDAAAALGVPGPRLDVDRARQKDRMRAAFDEHGMRTPRSVAVVGDQVDPAGLPALPVVVKPVDYSSSSGVTLVDAPEELLDAVRLARSKSFRGVALVEEYVGGTEYSVEGVVAGGRAVVCGVTEKHTTPPPYFVEVGHVFPAPIDPAEEAVVVAEAVRAVEAVGLVACGFHCEVKVDGGRAVCIEIAGRLAGDHIPRLVHEARGIDLYAAELAAVLGQDPEPHCRPTRDRTAAVRYLEAPVGRRITWPTVASIDAPELRSCLVDLEHEYPWYVDVPALDGAGRRLGHCILSGAPDEVAAAYEQARALSPGGAA